jgi:hypothetical protein
MKIDNVYRFVCGIFTYNYPPLSLLISNVYWLVYHIFTCIDYFGCFIFCFYVYVLFYATFVFQGLHVVLFINKVTCPIYITTLTFESRNNDKICINISTVNSCLKGTILNVNENFIKWVYNYSVALAHRVQHKVLKNTVNMKLIRF